MFLCTGNGHANVTAFREDSDEILLDVQYTERKLIPVPGLNKITEYDGTMLFYADSSVICVNNAEECGVHFTTIEQSKSCVGKSCAGKCDNVVPFVKRTRIKESQSEKLKARC